MRKIIILFFTMFCLHGCKQESNFDSPANQHIEEYSKEAKECEGSKDLNKDNIVQTDIIEKSSDKKADDIVINIEQNSQENKKEIGGQNQEINKTFTPNVETDLISRVSISDHSKYDIIIGDPNSKVQVIQYTSPTCTHCAYYNTTIFKYIKEKYVDTKKIAYIIREYISNKQDKDAAILCHCAGKERFLQFMNILYSTQSSWAYSTNYLESLVNIGKIGGVSEEQYKKCLDDKNLVDGLIGLTIEVSKQPKVVGTPVFFINGKLHENAYSEKELSKAINLELAKISNEK